MDQYIIFTMIFSVIASVLQKSSAVQCYVCSWSLKDEDNRTDWCTDDHFEPNVVYIHECELGCETIIYWDKNDVMEHWRRNCMQEKTKYHDTCHNDQDRVRRWKHCTCSTNYCNGAISWSSLPTTTTIAAVILLMLFSHPFSC